MGQEFDLQPTPRLRYAKAVYETGVEGNWTPILTFGGTQTDFTYATQRGYFRLMGNLVFLTFAITVTGVNTPTGAAKVENLPYAPEDLASDLLLISWNLLATNFVNIIGISSNPSANNINLVGATAAATSNRTSLQHTAFQNLSSVFGSGTFRISNKT